MTGFFDPSSHNWHQLQRIENQSYVCGFCGDKVSSDRGYRLGMNADGSGPQRGGLYICSNCQGPTFFSPGGRQYPSQALGKPVEKVPGPLSSLYEETRQCTSHNCHTAAVLCCRKMLMHIAVDKGAEKNLPFIKYVEYLSEQNYVPPNGKHWVDHIRKKGNEANHEIRRMREEDAKDLLAFTEMLLRFIYEFPGMVKESEDSNKAQSS